MRAALIQLTVSDDPVANLPVTVEGYIRQAVASLGATFVLDSGTYQRIVLQPGAQRPSSDMRRMIRP